LQRNSSEATSGIRRKREENGKKMGRKWDGNGKKMNDTVKFDNCSAIIRQNEFFSLETTG